MFIFRGFLFVKSQKDAWFAFKVLLWISYQTFHSLLYCFLFNVLFLKFIRFEWKNYLHSFSSCNNQIRNMIISPFINNFLWINFVFLLKFLEPIFHFNIFLFLISFVFLLLLFQKESILNLCWFWWRNQIKVFLMSFVQVSHQLSISLIFFKLVNDRVYILLKFFIYWWLQVKSKRESNS